MRAATTVAATLAEYAEEYIAKGRNNNKSESTLRIYKYWLTHEATDDHHGGIAAHVHDIESLDTLAVTRYFTTLREWGVKESTQHQAFRTLRSFYRWLTKPEIHGPLPHGNPLTDVDIIVPEDLPRVAEAAEVQKLLDACDGRSLSGLRSRAAVLAMADSLLRRQEVLNLRVCDWSRGDREALPSFTVRMGKGKKDRICSVGEETAMALRKYLDARENYGPLDPLIATESGVRMTGRGLAQVLYRLSERAGLGRRINPHSLRHFGATAWLRAGVGLEQLRQQLGHRDIKTTMRYLHMVPDDVQKAHVRASPLARLGIRIR